MAGIAIAVGKVYTAGMVALQGKHRGANPRPSKEGVTSPSYFLWELPIGHEETNGQGSPLIWSIESLLRAERRVEKGREKIWEANEHSSSWVIVKIQRHNI